MTWFRGDERDTLLRGGRKPYTRGFVIGVLLGFAAGYVGGLILSVLASS